MSHSIRFVDRAIATVTEAAGAQRDEWSAYDCDIINQARDADDEIEHLRAELEKHQWRQIETWESMEIRPMHVIAAEPCDEPRMGRYAIGEAEWHGDDEGWWWAGNHPTDAHGSRIYPTHWQLLPAEPRNTSAEPDAR